MKVALAQDWITDRGGGESCLRGFLDLYPGSPIYTLIWNEKKVKIFNDTEIHTSFLQKYPFSKTKWRFYFPLMPRAVESLNLGNCDVVISNCYSAIKGIITKPKTLHICYCHTPTRYLWLPHLDQRMGGGFLKRTVGSRLTHNLRLWDFAAAKRPDIFVGNSKNAAGRIKKFYRRKAYFIYPPVDISSFEVVQKSEVKDFYFFISRLIPYKKADLVVEAFNELGLPLKVAGDGPERAKLEKMAKGNVEILGRISDKMRKKLLSTCQAFIFPAEEDFGIAPLEAMASGRPVIAYGKGGALETVVARQTGEFFYLQTKEALIEEVSKFKPKEYDPQKIRAHAEEFDISVYKNKWKRFIETKFAEFKEGGRMGIEK